MNQILPNSIINTVFPCKFHVNRNSLHNSFFSSKFQFSRENPYKWKLCASYPIRKAACNHMVKFVFSITTFSHASKNIQRNLVNNSYPLQPWLSTLPSTLHHDRYCLKLVCNKCHRSTSHIKYCRVPQILPGVWISNDNGFYQENPLSHNSF